MTWKQLSNLQFVVMLVMCIAMWAQDKPTVKGPALDKDKIIAIKNLQVMNLQHVLRMQQLKDEYNTLQQENGTIVDQIGAKLKEAQMSVDKTEKLWKLNPQTLEFEPVLPDKKPDDKK